MSSEVVDLCDSDADDEVPSLAARLASKRGGAAAGEQQQQAPRDPLAAVQHPAGGGPSGGGNRAAAAAVAAAAAAAALPAQPLGGGGTSQLGGREVLRRLQAKREADRAARCAAEATAAGGGALAASGLQPAAQWQAGPLAPAQYHHQEQWPVQQDNGASGAALAGTQQPARRAPARGAGSGSQQQRRQSWGLPSQQTGDDGDDWLPPDSSMAGDGGSLPASRRASLAADAAGVPAKKARRPKRTAEEIEQDKLQKARAQADKKKVKQADSEKWALQQVRLLVDTGLMSAGGLGVNLLAHIEEHNRGVSAAKPEKMINYEVQPLDLAPFKALRWQRRRWVDASQADGASQQAAQLTLQGSQATTVLQSQLEEEWEWEPHVCICFQPHEFIDAVQRDRLASLFTLLERCAPGQRPHLLVLNLWGHIKKHEQRGYTADVRAGVQAREKSVKGPMEEFVAGLAVECPRLCYRDVVDAAQAAQHVRSLTAAIATRRHKASDATTFLEMQVKNGSTAMTNLFLKHDLDKSLKPFARSLTALPVVAPAAAHPLASYYGSLGGLMDMLLDPGRSDSSKEAEIADLQRVGTATARRVGPAVARSLLQLLRSDNPDLRIKQGKTGKEDD